MLYNYFHLKIENPKSIIVYISNIIYLYSLFFSGLGLCNLNPLSVILTDFKEVVPLLNSNIDLNCIMINNLTVQDCIRFKFSARAFSWGTNLIKKEIIVNPIIKPNLDGNFKIFIEDKNDVEVCSKRGSERGSERGGITNTNSLLEVDLVIASDVVYDPAGYEPLVKSLCELLGGNYQLWDGESKPEGFGQEERKEDSDVTTESSYDDSANSNTKSDNDQIKHKIDPISMTNTNIDYSMSSAISCSTPTSSSSLVPVYPMCILAHRHRHPENQRYCNSDSLHSILMFLFLCFNFYVFIFMFLFLCFYFYVFIYVFLFRSCVFMYGFLLKF